ncbi:hypothetical protein Nepgr_021530 [Nepenthes gracilis]|uniref:Uncharacterized protein n=1 Tax=Nepenthes gracilis TaxID=150966 RepID=A0AAD3SYR1_NEPGR|nr:hypothetical protein Nepgr_021530 [Nepenthes gracilis]
MLDDTELYVSGDERRGVLGSSRTTQQRAFGVPLEGPWGSVWSEVTRWRNWSRVSSQSGGLISWVFWKLCWEIFAALHLLHSVKYEFKFELPFSPNRTHLLVTPRQWGKPVGRRGSREFPVDVTPEFSIEEMISSCGRGNTVSALWSLSFGRQSSPITNRFGIELRRTTTGSNPSLVAVASSKLEEERVGELGV